MDLYAIPVAVRDEPPVIRPAVEANSIRRCPRSSVDRHDATS
jgi:hypothetical protein